jgi:hypothetical protein
MQSVLLAFFLRPSAPYQLEDISTISVQAALRRSAIVGHSKRVMQLGSSAGTRRDEVWHHNYRQRSFNHCTVTLTPHTYCSWNSRLRSTSNPGKSGENRPER